MSANTAEVSFLSKSGGGQVADRLLASNFEVNSLRTHDVLRRDEWKMFDRTVVHIARKRLIGIADLMRAGLTMNLPNALGVTRLEWEMDTDMTPADITMSGLSRSENDRIEFTNTGIPIPIIHKDFNINIRALESSRRGGTPLDTAQVGKATRMVVEKAETMLFNGYTGLGSNNTIYGYLNAPNRNTGSVTASWNTATGAQIVADVLAMIGRAQADHMYGPYVIYVSTTAYTHMADDYKAESDKTIMERVMAIPGISAIRATEELSGNNVLMVQMTSDVIQLINGIQPTLVEWDSHGGFVKHFKVLAIMVPRLRNDSENQSGLVHYS
jgi:uncharacterized linocin/CFP29 family protein